MSYALQHNSKFNSFQMSHIEIGGENLTNQLFIIGSMIDALNTSTIIRSLTLIIQKVCFGSVVIKNVISIFVSSLGARKCFT